ncbi:MAG: cytochrome c3 family protein [Eubacteriales bacterium]
MKKFSLVIALAMALMLTIGVSVALAAPGNYLPGTQTTTDKYTYALDSTKGKPDTTLWGLSNGLVNANQTGKNVDINDGSSFNDVIKNVGGERTHGEYANDTNSCASCHQTHTASGGTLLFRNGVYNTCTACHDGTLGAYNVFTSSNAGTFGGNPDKAVGNASVHLATGIMTTAAAPGGNRTGTDANTWGKEFTCASCHAPHGSYSDRLLSYDPNGMNHTPALDASGSQTGGKLIQNATVVFDAAYGKYTAADALGKTIPGPWLYGYTYAKPKIYWTQIRVKDANGVYQYKYSGDPTKSWNDVVTVNYRGGYFTDPNAKLAGVSASNIQIDVAPVTIVKMNETQTGTLPNGWPVYSVSSYASGVNSFCAACHTDYNSNSAQTETGTFSKAFRHRITQGLKTGMIGEGTSMVCLSCHFAHGTDKTIQKDARDVVGANLDVNASSALKRYVNMSICWKCHTSSHSESLVNNSSYWDKVDAGTAPIN